MKQYNGEKAIISLTSWKARINTVCKTLFSLIDQCPGFHIVLVLSEEEFPKKEDELPENLKIFIDNDLIEVLWVYKNYKSFKKVLFTMDKYRDVPVISADDDCIYKYNYAEELYRAWIKNKNLRISYWSKEVENGIYNTSGYAALHPPFYYKDSHKLIDKNIIPLNEDDLFYAVMCSILKHKGCKCLNRNFNDVARLHDETSPMHTRYRKSNTAKHRFLTMKKLIKVNIHEYHWK